MKFALPKGLERFDRPNVVLRKIPQHLAWFGGARVLECCDDEIRYGKGRLRPFTTLEIWLAERDIFPQRSPRVFILRGSRVSSTFRMYVSDLARKGSVILTPSAVSKPFNKLDTLVTWLAERSLSPPGHIFLPTASFVAEELPTSNSTYINPPAHHAR